jgi:hypothetical protein
LQCADGNRLLIAPVKASTNEFSFRIGGDRRFAGVETLKIRARGDEREMTGMAMNELRNDAVVPKDISSATEGKALEAGS